MTKQSGVYFSPDTKETRYKLQMLARHKMIARLYTDILCDMQVCEIEGFDKTEYINMLRDVVNGFGIRE